MTRISGASSPFRLIAASALVMACGSEPDNSGDDGLMTAVTAPSTSESSSGDDGSCPPGHDGCACAEGDLCLAGLECVAGACLPASDDGETGCEPGTLGCECLADVVLYCLEPWQCDESSDTCVKNPESGD